MRNPFKRTERKSDVGYVTITFRVVRKAHVDGSLEYYILEYMHHNKKTHSHVWYRCGEAHGTEKDAIDQAWRILRNTPAPDETTIVFTLGMNPTTKSRFIRTGRTSLTKVE